MQCTDCFRNCPTRITDLCLEYTGDNIPELGVCEGSTLADVESIIFEKLISALNGTGITIEDFVNCPTILSLLDSKEANMANLVQVLVTNACTLDEAIKEINARLDTPITINAPCLTLPTSPTRDDILKATATKVCEANTSITTVITDYVKASELCDSVQACLKAVNDGNTGTIVQEYIKMPKYVYMAYDGPLSVFDSTGKGLASAGYDKVYIANGNNGTKDLRGRVITGANTGVVGPTLDAAVDPSQAQNAGYSITQGLKKGSYTDTLVITELPTFSLQIPAQTFTLKIPGQRGGDNSDNNNTTAFAGGDKLPGDTGFNFTMSLPVTIPAFQTSSVGGGQPHNNTQPSYGAIWVIFIPS